MSFRPFQTFRGFGGGAAPFSPLSLSPALWMDASDASTLYDATSGGSLVAADGAVARWEDKSGNARHATQSASDSRPLRKTAILNSRDVLRFDGGDEMVHPLGITGENTVYAVARSTAPSVGSQFIAECANLSSVDYVVLSARIGNTAATPSEWGTYRNGAWRGSGNTLSTFAVVSLTATTGGGVFGHNGVATAHSFATFYPGDTLPRKSIGRNSAEALIGDLAELIVYPTAHASDQRLAVERYLGAKWGISVA